jgi:hypothetical protein
MKVCGHTLDVAADNCNNQWLTIVAAGHAANGDIAPMSSTTMANAMLQRWRTQCYSDGERNVGQRYTTTHGATMCISNFIFFHTSRCTQLQESSRRKPLRKRKCVYMRESVCVYLHEKDNEREKKKPL